MSRLFKPGFFRREEDSSYVTGIFWIELNDKGRFMAKPLLVESGKFGPWEKVIDFQGWIKLALADDGDVID